MTTKKRQRSCVRRTRCISDKKQHGGKVPPKLVGQGTYGCGFSPALRCSTNTEQPTNTFSKFMNASAATDEERITTRIKDINGAQKYSVYPTKKCAPHTNNIKAHADEFKRCGMLEQYIVTYPSRMQSWFNPSFENKVINHIDSYKVLQSPQGGIAFDTYIQPLSITSDPAKIIDLFIGLQNLFEGLDRFHTLQYYHMDIKMPNIVVKTIAGQTPQIRFIDFGLSIDGNAPISNVSETYRQTYFAWPFELRYFEQMEYAARRKDVGLLANQLRDFYKKGLKYSINSHGIPESHYTDSVDGTQIFRPNMIKPLLENLIAAGKDSKFLFATTDIYSMGILLSNIIYQTTHIFINNNRIYYDNAGVEKPINNSSTDNLIKRFAKQFAADALILAADCTQFNPLRRPTAEELYKRYNIIIQSLINNKSYVMTGLLRPSMFSKKALPPLPASITTINIPQAPHPSQIPLPPPLSSQLPPPPSPSQKLKPARLPNYILQRHTNRFKVTKKNK